MLFNSLHFVAFFPMVVALYFIIPKRFRWVMLLIASYYFYMCWRVEYALLILTSTAIDYAAALLMYRTQKKGVRLFYLILSLTTNLGLLFAFKYFNFFSDSLQAVFAQFNLAYAMPELKVLLPIGISFYTFQTLSYTIDVYRGHQEPERHFGIFALYVSFFPQLVAGPIERSARLLPQFFEEHQFDLQQAKEGLVLMLWGFFKKLVIADRLAVYVDQVYNSPEPYGGGAVALATYFFAFQIYADFSGYSDIAIGSAQVMGYRLMTNFNRPYFADSIGDFWRRWHISLSTWFRDYVYIPLGGNRTTRRRWVINIMAVFLLSGLWHGANWTFVIWGGLHGLYLLVGEWTAALREKAAQALGLANAHLFRKLVQILITFHLVWLGWVFFRANCVGDAFRHLRAIATAASAWNWGPLHMKPQDLYAALGVIGFLIVIQVFQRDRRFDRFLYDAPTWIRWSLLYTLLLGILVLGKFTKQEFIYFQF